MRCDGGAMAPRARLDALIVDGLIAAAFAVLSGLLIVELIDGAGARAVAGAIALAHVAPLAVRRRWPLAVLATMVASALLTVPLGVPVVVLGPAVLVAAYTVGAC